MDWDSPTPSPTPPAAPPAQPPPQDKQRHQLASISLVAAGVVAGAVLAGSLVAGAQTGTPTPAPHSGTCTHVAETPLTGATADKVKAAALAALPGGTVLRVETDSEGSPYEAHVRKADGSEVVVKVDKDFEVTSIEEHHGRHGGPPAQPSSASA